MTYQLLLSSFTFIYSLSCQPILLISVPSISPATAHIYTMDLFQCPICLTNVYYDQTRKMLFSELCKHRTCDSCVDRLFGASDRTLRPCPECRQPLMKMNYVEREPEDEKMELAAAVRNRISKVYNNTRSRFQSTPMYHDYIERREEISNTKKHVFILI
eukprot:GHVQ01029488.1.p1 GENE.GHVQ01029488.1~~GHVQ01029488.1.p1  ORF type:complete len:159 (-),score=7.67 GHVQ01029488.1:106-582(-)